MSQQFFQIDYTDTYFYDTPDSSLYGTAKYEDGYYLRTREAGENPGRLYFRDENRPGGQQETEDFRIRVIVDEEHSIRPGDDMQLRFGIAGFTEYDTEVSAGDFMAVYDKKMMWRAQLYIDERINEDSTPSGDNDWNDLNPWTSAQGNQWDTLGNGEQCELSAWTRWNDGVNIFNTTAYGWGCADSVADFKADLEEQKNALTAYYSDENNEKYGENNPHPSEHRDWSPWNHTYAPGEEGIDRWHNYLFGIYNSDHGTYDALPGFEDQPYMPGLSTWKRFDEEDQYNYVPSDVKRSAGVDCVGFVQRCASYDGNPYEADDINERCIWGGGMPARIAFSSDQYSWFIDNRNLLIPGDVLILPGDPGHIAMVLKIVYLANSRIIALNDNGTSDGVFVIEATKGDDEQWMVLNSQTWQDLGVGYIRRRLRINE